METTLTITNIQPAMSRAGKTYWKVQTDQGNMSCFEESVAEQLKVGSTMNLEVAKSGQWTNIRGIGSGPAVMTSDDAVKPGAVVETPIKTKPVVSQEKIAEALTGLAMGLYAEFSNDMSFRDCSEQVMQEYLYFVKELDI